MASDYIRNLPFKMEEFYNSDENARKVLDAYNTVDPLHCFYGEELNPDEYLGYARRYFEVLRDEYSLCDSTYERVVETFYKSQLVGETWVTKADCEKIATLIDAE